VSDAVAGDGFRLRRADPADAPFLAEVASGEEVAPFMAAVSPRDVAAFLAELERDAAEPAEVGRFVIEMEEDRTFRPVGSIAFATTNRRSRIAHLHGLMLHPDARGRGLARAATIRFAEHLLGELDFHRIELEVYGFNDHGIAHFEACGFVREGVRRRAYRRHGDWVDGVFFGLLREDLPLPENTKSC
jgi:RimJ/RimL family protein N-acetyltransferase